MSGAIPDQRPLSSQDSEQLDGQGDGLQAGRAGELPAGSHLHLPPAWRADGVPPSPGHRHQSASNSRKHFLLLHALSSY